MKNWIKKYKFYIFLIFSLLLCTLSFVYPDHIESIARAFTTFLMVAL